MFCVPNIPGKLGRWACSEVRVSKSGRHYDTADFDFISETVALQEEPVFCDGIVAHVRSDRRLLRRVIKRTVALLAALRHRIARGASLRPSQ
jgi:hypothetical protein